jgi:hypothetical protein
MMMNSRKRREITHETTTEIENNKKVIIMELKVVN